MARSVGFRFGCILLCAAAWAACQQPSRSASSITAEDLAKRIGAGAAPVILDVRSPAEYAAGHIPGAINIPHDQLATRLGEIPTGQSGEIVVHCQAGKRAATAEGTLAQAGYTNVHDLEGHMFAWVQGGFPVEGAKTP